MPKKSSVKTTFQKAAVTPSKRLQGQRSYPVPANQGKQPVSAQRQREAWAVPMAKPKGLSPLAQYLLDNEGSLPVTELIEQFQEYDCEHVGARLLCDTVTYRMTVCDDCGLIAKKMKSVA